VREPEFRFRMHLSEVYKKLPSDPFFDEINPLEYLMMFESWVYGIENRLDEARAHAILVGSFYNPKMAQKMAQKDKTNEVEMTDEQFEKVFEEEVKAQKPQKKRRKRRVVK
jgi:hypothetical protein